MKNFTLQVKQFKEIFYGNNVHEPTREDYYNYIKMCAILDCKSDFTGTLLPDAVAFDIFVGLFS